MPLDSESESDEEDPEWNPFAREVAQVQAFVARQHQANARRHHQGPSTPPAPRFDGSGDQAEPGEQVHVAAGMAEPAGGLGVLQAWAQAHANHPVSLISERNHLARISGFTYEQVSSWFMEYRVLPTSGLFSQELPDPNGGQ